MRNLKVGDYVRCYLSGTFQIMSIDGKQVWLKRKFTEHGRFIKNATPIKIYFSSCYLAEDCITRKIESELNILKHIHETNTSNIT